MHEVHPKSIANQRAYVEGTQAGHAGFTLYEAGVRAKQSASYEHFMEGYSDYLGDREQMESRICDRTCDSDAIADACERAADRAARAAGR